MTTESPLIQLYQDEQGYRVDVQIKEHCWIRKDDHLNEKIKSEWVFEWALTATEEQWQRWVQVAGEAVVLSYQIHNAQNEKTYGVEKQYEVNTKEATSNRASPWDTQRLSNWVQGSLQGEVQRMTQQCLINGKMLPLWKKSPSKTDLRAKQKEGFKASEKNDGSQSEPRAVFSTTVEATPLNMEQGVDARMEQFNRWIRGQENTKMPHSQVLEKPQEKLTELEKRTQHNARRRTQYR